LLDSDRIQEDRDLDLRKAATFILTQYTRSPSSMSSARNPASVDDHYVLDYASKEPMAGVQ